MVLFWEVEAVVLGRGWLEVVDFFSWDVIVWWRVKIVFIVLMGG